MGEAVGQSRVERFGAAIIRLLVILPGGRVHCRPAIDEALDRKPLRLALVDDGKELVLDVGPAAADLVEDHRARAPDRGRRRHVAQALLAVGQRETHEVVEAEQARVVVPAGEPEGGRDAGQQQRLRGAVRTDQEQGFAGDQGAKNDGREAGEAVEAKCRERIRRHTLRILDPFGRDVG